MPRRRKPISTIQWIAQWQDFDGRWSNIASPGTWDEGWKALTKWKRANTGESAFPAYETRMTIDREEHRA